MAINISEETYGKVVLSAENDIAFLKGEIDTADPGEYLTPFFNKIIEQMDGTVKVNFTQLNFLNSSGIKCIVSFVMNKKSDDQVVFLTDKGKTWQKTSLAIIKSLDDEHVTIELC